MCVGSETQREETKEEQEEDKRVVSALGVDGVGLSIRTNSTVLQITEYLHWQYNLDAIVFS